MFVLFRPVIPRLTCSLCYVRRKFRHYHIFKHIYLKFPSSTCAFFWSSLLLLFCFYVLSFVVYAAYYWIFQGRSFKDVIYDSSRLTSPSWSFTHPRPHDNHLKFRRCFNRSHSIDVGLHCCKCFRHKSLAARFLLLRFSQLSRCLCVSVRVRPECPRRSPPLPWPRFPETLIDDGRQRLGVGDIEHRIRGAGEKLRHTDWPPPVGDDYEATDNEADGLRWVSRNLKKLFESRFFFNMEGIFMN